MSRNEVAAVIGQRVKLAARQMTAQTIDLAVENVEPLTLRHRPTGEEFMVEVRVLPMGEA